MAFLDRTKKFVLVLIIFTTVGCMIWKYPQAPKGKEVSVLQNWAFSHDDLILTQNSPKLNSFGGSNEFKAKRKHVMIFVGSTRQVKFKRIFENKILDKTAMLGSLLYTGKCRRNFPRGESKE